MTRRAWILVSTAYLFGFLGLLIAIALVQRQAESLERSRDTLADLAVNVTASICMQAFASEREESALIIMFTEGQETLVDEPACIKAIKIARRQVEEAKE